MRWSIFSRHSQVKWITPKSIQLLFFVRTKQKGLMFEDNKAS